MIPLRDGQRRMIKSQPRFCRRKAFYLSIVVPIEMASGRQVSAHLEQPKDLLSYRHLKISGTAAKEFD